MKQNISYLSGPFEIYSPVQNSLRQWRILPKDAFPAYKLLRSIAKDSKGKSLIFSLYTFLEITKMLQENRKIPKNLFQNSQKSQIN